MPGSSGHTAVWSFALVGLLLEQTLLHVRERVGVSYPEWLARG